MLVSHRQITKLQPSRHPSRGSTRVNLESMNRSERSILIVTGIGHALCHWCALLVTGIFTPLRAEFGLTGFQVSALPVIGYVLMGVGALPAGYFTDRWGPKPMLVTYFISTALACVFAALATSAFTFAVALTLLGAAVSLYHPTGLAMISHGLEKRGQAMGVHGIAGSIGLCGGAFAMFLAELWNWRVGYWVMGGVSILSLVVMLCLPIELQEDTGDAVEPNAPSTEPRKPPLRLLVFLFVPMMLSGINYRAVMTALPTYLAGGDDNSTLTKLLLFLVFIAGGASQFIMGRRADRSHPSKLYAALIAISVPLALILAWTGGGSLIAIAVAVALAVVHFGTQPVENLLIAEHTPRSLRSVSYGLKFTLTFGLGPVAVPLVGYMWDATGTLAWTFVLFAAIAVVVAVMIMQLVKLVDAQSLVLDSRVRGSDEPLGTVDQTV